MKISIITVVYNNVEFVGETITSVLSQDYPSIEPIPDRFAAEELGAHQWDDEGLGMRRISDES